MQGCRGDLREDTVPKAEGTGLTRVSLSHVRPECPSCVSVGSRAESVQTIGIQMCGASDEHDVEFVGDGRGPPVQVRSGPLKLTNHHLHRTRQLVDHGATHSDTENPPLWADGKSLPHTEALPFQPRNMYATADVLRRFGGSSAQGSVDGGSMHEVVASKVWGWSQY